MIEVLQTLAGIVVVWFLHCTIKRAASIPVSHGPVYFNFHPDLLDYPPVKPLSAIYDCNPDDDPPEYEI